MLISVTWFVLLQRYYSIGSINILIVLNKSCLCSNMRHTLYRGNFLFNYTFLNRQIMENPWIIHLCVGGLHAGYLTFTFSAELSKWREMFFLSKEFFKNPHWLNVPWWIGSDPLRGNNIPVVSYNLISSENSAAGLSVCLLCAAAVRQSRGARWRLQIPTRLGAKLRGCKKVWPQFDYSGCQLLLVSLHRRREAVIQRLCLWFTSLTWSCFF